MAELRFHGVLFFLLYYICLFQVFSNPVSIPLLSVPDQLIQSALNSLNEDSPTQHEYKGGNLISAQKLDESPYIIFRLTFNLIPICKEAIESCPQEACTIDVKQHEQATVYVERNSIQCMYLYPQSIQNDVSQARENIQDTSLQDQESVDNIDKQSISNHSIELHHEIQTAKDQSDKPFIAVRASTSNYCAGCPYELNPNLPGLIVFGDEATKSMDELIVNDYKHKLIRVVKVTRAVPPSSNVVEYQLLLEIGESDCLKNSLLEQSECSLQKKVPTRMCLVTFEQEPLQYSSRRITRNNCTVVSAPSETNVRSIISSDSLITTEYNKGQVNQENSDKNLKDMLFEDLAEQVTSSQTTMSDIRDKEPMATEYPFIKTLVNKSCEEEKPMGFTDKIKEFNEFLENFDLPVKSDYTNSVGDQVPINEEMIRSERVFPKSFIGTEINDKTSTTNINTYNTFTEGKERTNIFSRKKRTYSPVSSEKFLLMLGQKAVNDLDDIDTDNNKRFVIDVLKSKRQKVNEHINYYLILKVLDTSCDEKITHIKNCVEKIPQSIKICKIHIHINNTELLHDAKVVSSECHDESNKIVRREKRADTLLGAPVSKNVDDPVIQSYAELGLRKFSQLSEGMNEPIITEILEASSQVVAGTLHKIKVKIGTSDCPKGTKENCQLKADSEIKECLITVFSQPWIDKGSPDPSNVQINCSANRRKRSLRGVAYSQKMLAQAEYLKNEKMFEEFMHNFKRSYPTVNERKIRFKVFRQNLKLIQELQKNEQGTAQYGVTMFADLTPEEFRARYLGLRPELKSENQIPIPMAQIPDIDLPTEFDWRHYNVVTPVKDQGQCGSCWAFSVTGNVEGQYAIKHRKLLSLSEQELVDCDKLDEGCNGGLPDNAYRAIEDLGGLELESDYPYEAEDEQCHFDQNDIKVKVISAVNITSNETQMAQWLVKNGPISIGINANAMQFYVGGISHPFKFLCNPKNLDHGVLIVGYGIRKYPLFKKELPYWLIKNSWGPRWGEQGYYRVYRGDGTCGVNAMPTSAIVA